MQLQYRDLRDGHGPDRGPGLHHSQHLLGPAIPLGGYMPDHPGIARTSGSELHSFEPAAPHNTPVEQAGTVPAAGKLWGTQTWNCQIE